MGKGAVCFDDMDEFCMASRNMLDVGTTPLDQRQLFIYGACTRVYMDCFVL